MFETVVPETVGKRSKKVFYETLPVSLAAHAIAIAGVLLSTIWQVAFPDHSPHLSMAYSLTSVPDPPPPPPPPQVMDRTPEPEPKPQNVAPPPPALLEMAPRVIPNLVPHVEIPAPVPPPPPKVAVAEAVPGGDVNGEKGGKVGGEVGGKGTTAFSLVFPDDGRVYIDRDAKLPLTPIQQEYPHYPSEAVKKHWEDSVLVRYVIGTNGRVKDVTILDHAHQPIFDEAAVNAIKGWSFRPMKKEGRAVEVVHELTVFFQLVTH